MRVYRPMVVTFRLRLMCQPRAGLKAPRYATTLATPYASLGALREGQLPEAPFIV